MSLIPIPPPYVHVVVTGMISDSAARDCDSAAALKAAPRRTDAQQLLQSLPTSEHDVPAIVQGLGAYLVAGIKSAPAGGVRNCQAAVFGTRDHHCSSFSLSVHAISAHTISVQRTSAQELPCCVGKVGLWLPLR